MYPPYTHLRQLQLNLKPQRLLLDTLLDLSRYLSTHENYTLYSFRHRPTQTCGLGRLFNRLWCGPNITKFQLYFKDTGMRWMFPSLWFVVTRWITPMPFDHIHDYHSLCQRYFHIYCKWFNPTKLELSILFLVLCGTASPTSNKFGNDCLLLLHLFL